MFLKISRETTTEIDLKSLLVRNTGCETRGFFTFEMLGDRDKSVVCERTRGVSPPSIVLGHACPGWSAVITLSCSWCMVRNYKPYHQRNDWRIKNVDVCLEKPLQSLMKSLLCPLGEGKDSEKDSQAAAMWEFEVVSYSNTSAPAVALDLWGPGESLEMLVETLESLPRRVTAIL